MHRVRALARGDRGSTTLELAIVFPVVLMVVVALVQYGLWFHARTLAQAAAADGAAAARAYGSTPAVGQSQAETFIADHAGDLLLDAAVTVSVPAPGHVAVEVRAHTLSLLPLLPGPQIVQSASGPIEQFTQAAP